MYDISIIVMASGLSKRMGENKLLLDFNGKKMYEYVIDAVKKCNVKQKIIVSAYDEILDYCNNTDLICVKNNESNLGQSVSIVLGVSKANTDGYMFMPCDMPFITADIINEICEHFVKDTDKIIVPQINGKNTMPTIFSHIFRSELLSIQGDIGGREIIKAHKDKVKYIDVSKKKCLVDIDTKEDVKKYKIK